VHRRLALLAPPLLLAACGSSSPKAQAPAKPPAAQFLHVHARRHAVDLTLIAGDGAGNNGFNFDGYGRGELTVIVPRGWRVSVHFRNAGSERSSCVVVDGPDATTTAFPSASTPSPSTGLEQGASATFSFTASRTGSYRFASTVAGQELARMWDVLEVTKGGRPSISARRGP
jgi:hypothetical protein